MKEIFKRNSIKMMGAVVVIAIPFGTWFITQLKIFQNTNNDWVGFWGAYFSSIIATIVALYVLNKTLDGSRRNEDRKEIVEFCDKITEKISLYAQGYEETLYKSHLYLLECEKEAQTQSVSENRKTLYIQCIESHHKAKVLLYEIMNYLEVRKDNGLFSTPTFWQVQKEASAIFDEFCNFETRIGNAKEIAQLEQETLVEEVESFLNVVRVYLRELLTEVSLENGKKMLSLEEIYKKVNSKKLNKKEMVAERYVRELNQEINGDVFKLMVYKGECVKKVNLDIKTYEVAVLGVIMSLFSACVTFLTWAFNSTEISSKYTALNLIIALIMLCVGYYICRNIQRNKYMLIQLALEHIESDMKRE